MVIRILLEMSDLDGVGNPEVSFYHYDEEATEMMDYDYSLFASSRAGNGRYDEIAEDAVDADDTGELDKYERKLYLQLADAFAQLSSFHSTRRVNH